MEAQSYRGALAGEAKMPFLHIRESWVPTESPPPLLFFVVMEAKNMLCLKVSNETEQINTPMALSVDYVQVCIQLLRRG